MSLLRKIVSLGYWSLDSEKSLSDFRKKANWKEQDLIVEAPSDNLMSPLVITAHVFYPDFATQLINKLKDLPRDTRMLITTPSNQIKDFLDSYLKSAGNPHDVRLTPNIGRNFGPLLVEFSKELLNVESFIHVHSKKTLHSPQIAKEWLKRNTDLLLTMRGLLRISSITQANPNIGLVYADVSDLLWGINFRWGRSRKIAKNMFENLPGFENIEWGGKLSFPAGGMFWARTQAIRPLLEINWTYEMFPQEQNQRDGELQHAQERIVGELTHSLSFNQAAYLDNNRFSLK